MDLQKYSYPVIFLQSDLPGIRLFRMKICTLTRWTGRLLVTSGLLIRGRTGIYSHFIRKEMKKDNPRQSKRAINPEP
jgi:hypothetical protein